MLIPNLPTFTGIDPASTPGIKHGNLDPTTQFSSAELLGMAVGSLYIQKSVELSINCAVLSTSACLWIKIDRSQDNCNALGSAKDWRRCCCFNMLEGTTPPAPSEQPFCGAQTGDWYLQDDLAGCTALWLKIRDQCGSNDWYNVTGSCLVSGVVPPNPLDLCHMDVGSHYVDTSTPCPTVYIKIADNCNDGDWLSLADGCVYSMAGTPVGNTVDPALCKLPIGAIVRNTSDGNRLYIKISDDCLGIDYQPLQMRLTKVQDFARSTINPATYELNLPPSLIGHRRRNYVTEGRILVPPGAWLQVTNLTEVMLDTASLLVTPMCPITPSDGVYIPITGYWHIEARASWEGSSACNTGVAVGVGATIYSKGINPVLAFTDSQNEAHFSGQITQGSFVHVWVTTDKVGGLQTGSIELYARLENPQ